MVNSMWVAAIAGGVLIGLASGGLMLLTGRIAGISGMFHRVIEGQRDTWRIDFLAGLVVAGFVMVIAFPAASSTIAITPKHLGSMALAGLLVGYGTRMANGCTSGHGVCGLARFSTRSLAAVVTFLLSGVVVTFALRAIGGAS